MYQKHVLIPGGAGYVGTALTRELLDAGYHVTALTPFCTGMVSRFSNFSTIPDTGLSAAT